MDGKVERVIIADKFRLSQHEFELLQYIMTQIIQYYVLLQNGGITIVG